MIHLFVWGKLHCSLLSQRKLDLEQSNKQKLTSAQKRFLAKPQTFIVSYASGHSPTVTNELRRILQSPLQDYKFEPQVKDQGERIYLQNIDFRQALEVLLRAKTIKDLGCVLVEKRVGSKAEFQQLLQKIPFAAIFPQRCHFSVFVDCVGSRLYHEKMLAEMTQSHLTKCGWNQPYGDQQRLAIFVRENRCQVVCSLLGEPAYKRGYRENLTSVASIREDVAAIALREFLQFLQLKPTQNDLVLTNPFAGSGTLAFEFLDLIYGRPNRPTNLAVESWLVFPAQTFQYILSQLTEPTRLCGIREVRFIEKDPSITQSLADNIARYKARLSQNIEYNLETGDVFETGLTSQGTVVLANPPYGNRIALPSNFVANCNEYFSAADAVLVFCPDMVFFRAVIDSGKFVRQHNREFRHGGQSIILGMASKN